MKKLRRIRAEKGLTMDALEERTGVSKRTISEIERGMRTPQTLTLAKLANALGVKLDDLLEEEAPKASGPARQPKLEEPPAGPTDEERRLVRGWEVILEDLATRYREAENEFRAAEVEVSPNSAADLDNLAGYLFKLLSREAEEVKAAPSVLAATEKIRSTQASVRRMLNQQFGPLAVEHAAQLDKFKADAAASLSGGASTEKAEDERREAN